MSLAIRGAAFYWHQKAMKNFMRAAREFVYRENVEFVPNGSIHARDCFKI